MVQNLMTLDHQQTDSEFRALAQETLSSLSSILEAGLPDEIEVDYTGNILKVILSPINTFIINIHNPTREIWLSSPLSGAHHFIWENQRNKWQSTRPPYLEFLTILEEDLSHICGFSVRLK